jgi:hypothetical protein
MMITAEQAAAELGIHASRVRRIAANRGLGRKHGSAWAFTATDIDAMRTRTPGRPARREKTSD